ncbi:MAG: right-handed parallel beta-helix repeat-containing protein [Solirubrobacterales bacterium]
MTSGRADRANIKLLAAAATVAGAATAVLLAVVDIDGTRSGERLGAAAPSRKACDKVASPRGSNANRGTAANPYATVGKLGNSLRPGQTGCLRAGVYRRNVKVRKGGRPGAPTTIRSYPGERATVRGRIHVANSANHVVVRQLFLDGRNRARLPSPTVNGNNVVFRDNDVTTRNTTICFLLGSDEYGRARRTLIERNRIHNCGRLPPTNHHHGIYVEASTGARITGNWIYDNADRGVQLFPDAQDTYVARNVIDGNGEGVVFSRKSSRNVVEYNVLSNPVVRYNIEDFELSGARNVARRNCLWSTRHPDQAGVQPDIEVPVLENLVTEPAYVSRDAKDFRLRPDSPCVQYAPGSRRPGPR